MAISPRTIWASLSPSKVRMGLSAPLRLTVVSSQTWLAQPCTLLASLCAAADSGGTLPPQLEQIAVTVVPIVEDREIVGNVVDIGEALCHALYIGRRAWRVDIFGSMFSRPATAILDVALGVLARRTPPCRCEIGRAERILRGAVERGRVHRRLVQIGFAEMAHRTGG